MARVKIGNVRTPIEYLKQFFAPAGYGLGSSVRLTEKDDINTIKTNGWYHWHRDFVPANLPTMYGTGNMTTMRVWTNDGGVCCQEIMDMTDSTTSGCRVQRILYGSDKVYEWEWVNPPMQTGIEYRTTERFKTKPVYRKIVLYNLPKEMNTDFAVPHGISNFNVLVRQFPSVGAGIPLPYTHNGNTTWVSEVTDTNILVSNSGQVWNSSYTWNFELAYTKTTD